MKELKCSCGGTAQRVNDIEYKGLTFAGWRCERCNEETVDPHQANLYLNYAKIKKAGKQRARSGR